MGVRRRFLSVEQRYSLRRWGSMFCCGLVAAAIWLVMHDSLDVVLSPIRGVLDDLSLFARLSVVFVVALALVWPFAHNRWLAFLGVRHFFAYPPLWVAVLVALATAFGLSSSPAHSLDALAPLAAALRPPAWLSFLLVAGFFAIAQIRPRRAAESQPDAESRTDAWFLNDDPVRALSDDRFEFGPIAQRLARRLSSRGDDTPTMAVIGPPGSGKSTLGGLVREALAPHDDVDFVQISLWPFDSPQAAVAGVIHRLIESISLRVSTLSLTGIPDRYIRVVEGIAGRSLPFGIASDKSSPEQTLRRISAIHTALNIRTVLWIDDLERFVGSERSGRVGDSSSGADARIVLAMLYLLDQCKHVSVIIADASLDHRIDSSKIARYIERMPELDTNHAWREISEVRQGLLAIAGIDPASPHHRKILSRFDDHDDSRVLFEAIHGHSPTIPEAIATVVRTPRELKTMLRIVREIGTHLRGEIDLDDVIVVSAVRVSCPDVFAFITANIGTLRNGFHQPDPLGDRKNAPHPALTALNSLLGQQTQSGHDAALRSLLEHLFPVAFAGVPADQVYLSCPQGISILRHCDYWQRYLTLPAISHESSDQAALVHIRDWKDGGPNRLAALMHDEYGLARVMTFAGMFSCDELSKLLPDIAHFRTHDKHSQEGYTRTEVALLGVLTMMCACGCSSALCRDGTLNSLRVLDARQLETATRLTKWVIDNNNPQTPFMDTEDCRLVHRGFRKYLFRQCAGSTEELATSFAVASHDLSQSIMFLLSFRRKQREVPCRAEREFVRRLVSAVSVAPENILPQIVRLFTTIHSDGHQKVASMCDIAVQLLLDKEVLVTVLQNHDVPINMAPDMHARWVAAKRWAEG